jgi:hypothetical protein
MGDGQPLWHEWVRKIAAQAPTQLKAILVDGGDADDLGGAGLQAVADMAGVPVIANQRSVLHGGKVYWPRETVDADVKPPGMRPLEAALQEKSKRRILERPKHHPLRVENH